jgi:hypothetical protein
LSPNAGTEAIKSAAINPVRSIGLVLELERCWQGNDQRGTVFPPP